MRAPRTNGASSIGPPGCSLGYMDAGSASDEGGGARPEGSVDPPVRALVGLPFADEPGASPDDDAISLAHRATEELRAAADLMSDAQRVANFGSWEWRLDEDEVSWSDQLYRIFGLDPKRDAATLTVTLSTYLERVHADDRDLVQGAIEKSLAETMPFRFEHRILRPDGEERCVRCQGEPIVDPVAERIVRVVGVCQDVTELATVERARSDADARFRSAFENAPIGIALIDFSEGADGRLTEVNRALCDLTGRDPQELIGTPMTGLGLAEDSELDQPLRERLVAGEIERYSVEKRALLSDDRLVWLQLNVSTVPEVETGKLAGIAQIQDVTERKRFEEQLRYIADHDSLTGLMNRRRFREELESHLALRRRYGGSGALLSIDVDRLKAVNDTRGHGAGDVVLRRVAEAMRGRIRTTDIAARLAGDEFAILLPNTDGGEAAALGKALIERLGGEEIAAWDVSISVGVASFGGSATGSTEDVMATADAAMYRAKQRGGGVVELAAQPTAELPHSRTETEYELPLREAVAATRHEGEPPPPLVGEPTSLAERVRLALEAGELLLYAQPVVDLRSGRIAHHELLLRMRDEATGQVLTASDFLGAAAQAKGLCSAIDRWVVDETLAMLANGSRGSRFQVNLSGETVGDESSLTALADRVGSARLEPGALGFEIGEGSVRRDLDQALDAIRRLGATGCPLVLDGFSASFGSFSYLQKLPVDQIKIDGTVISSLAGEQPDHATIGAIVRLAQGTDKSTVAKLVESDDIVPVLRMHGVDMAQGFEMGQPVPVAA